MLDFTDVTIKLKNTKKYVIHLCDYAQITGIDIDLLLRRVEMFNPEVIELPGGQAIPVEVATRWLMSDNPDMLNKIATDGIAAMIEFRMVYKALEEVGVSLDWEAEFIYKTPGTE